MFWLTHARDRTFAYTKYLDALRKGTQIATLVIIMKEKEDPRKVNTFLGSLCVERRVTCSISKINIG